MKYERLTRHSDLGTLHACDINGKEQPLCELTAVDTDILINRLCILEDKIESGELDYVADRDKEISRLTAENAELRAMLSKMETVEKELRARLDKAVELPRIIHPNTYEWFVQYQNEYGLIFDEIVYSERDAEAQLKEMKEKNSD